MSQFVEECRREWKRLRVPRGLADEMADDLSADLEEAEADGASVEEVLGSGASDPRAFAAAWASARGIVQPRRLRRLPRPRLVVTALLFVLLAFAGGGLAFLAFSSGTETLRAASVTPATVVVPGATIGTAVFGANVQPSGIALAAGRATILHRRPTAISVTFGNSSARTVEVAHFLVQIGLHTYTATARHMGPNSHRTLHIALPPDLPTRFTVFASTRPVGGETNRSNNRQTWHVVVRQ